jgi:hypothetical protein
MKTKFAIGCLVQWYEIEIIEEYIDSLKDAIEYCKDKDIILDFTFVTNQDLEKIEGNDMINIVARWRNIMKSLKSDGFNINDRFEYRLHTIADYRRQFNDTYCEKVDVLVWGESDMLAPKQMFQVLDMLHQQVKITTPKYLSFFGTCKMWDDTWNALEHPDFTNKPFKDLDFDSWWSHHYTMCKKEMDEINSKTEEPSVGILHKHKFNGCGLVISADVVKAGANIPRSVFFTHEDTAFMLVTNKLLGNIPEYVINNILLVHNRHHPKKRMYVKGESGENHERRLSNNWYKIASKLSEHNTYNLFNNQKFHTWDDVWAKTKEYHATLDE